MKTLASLQIHETAIVDSIVAIGPLRRKILEMGIINHVKIKRVGTAPMGDPMAFEIRGYTISLRRVEAEHILIKSQGGVS